MPTDAYDASACRCHIVGVAYIRACVTALPKTSKRIRQRRGQSFPVLWYSCQHGSLIGSVDAVQCARGALFRVHGRTHAGHSVKARLLRTLDEVSARRWYSAAPMILVETHATAADDGDRAAGP